MKAWELQEGMVYRECGKPYYIRVRGLTVVGDEIIVRYGPGHDAKVYPWDLTLVRMEEKAHGRAQTPKIK